MLNNDSTTKAGVLFVDDEEKALKYFRMAFAEAFEIHTALSAEEGLATLRAQAGKIAVVISDQRMPGTVGADFLAQVRSEYPNIIRILTTAYSDLNSAIRAVNRGHIYQYVTKPWDIQDLQGILRRAADYQHVLSERDQLLALKMSTLQRILCSDRLKWLLIHSRSLSERKQAAFRRALSAFVNAIPLPLNPAVSAGAGFKQRDFDIAALIQDEYSNATRCLDLINAWTTASSVDPLPEALSVPLNEMAAMDSGEMWSLPDSLKNFLSALIATSGVTPEEVSIETDRKSAVSITITPADASFSEPEFLRQLFGLLIERETSELSILFFEMLLALSVSGGSLKLAVHSSTSTDGGTIMSFAPAGNTNDLGEIVNGLYEKFSAADISTR
jgi:ActR/RegA family two-component response regulator